MFSLALPAVATAMYVTDAYRRRNEELMHYATQQRTLADPDRDRHLAPLRYSSASLTVENAVMSIPLGERVGEGANARPPRADYANTTRYDAKYWERRRAMDSPGHALAAQPRLKCDFAPARLCRRVRYTTAQI